MKRKFIVLVFAVFMTACSNYQTYPTAEKVILITETTIVTEATTQINDSDIVYYTKNGKRYHYKNPCGKGTYYECTLYEAVQNGLTPCGKCTK